MFNFLYMRLSGGVVFTGQQLEKFLHMCNF